MKISELVDALKACDQDRHIMIQIGSGDRSELISASTWPKDAHQYMGVDEKIIILQMELADDVTLQVG